MDDSHRFIGRVTRCSTQGFVGAIRQPEPEAPTFGSFCKVEAQQGQIQVIGLIYDISIEDDEFARQMASADNLTPEQLVDSQHNRQVPVEFSALTIGYQKGDRSHHTLPPQPPLTLDSIYTLILDEVLVFTQRLDFLPLVLGTPTLPVDNLLVMALKRASMARPENERKQFMLQAGRDCARFLARDLTRTETLIKMLGDAL